MALMFILMAGLILVSSTVMFGLILFLRQVPKDTEAIIVTGGARTRVYLNPCIPIPIIHRAERIELSAQSFHLERCNENGLLLGDGVRLNVRLRFSMKVNSHEADILEVVRTVGAQRASDPETLRELFEARFSEALKTAAKGYELEVALVEQGEIIEKMESQIGNALGGYSLEEIAVERWEQTDIKFLDPDNILDAKGIRKLRTLELQAAKENAALARKEQAQNRETQVVAASESAHAEAQAKAEMEALIKEAEGAPEAAKLGLPKVEAPWEKS